MRCQPSDCHCPPRSPSATGRKRPTSKSDRKIAGRGTADWRAFWRLELSWQSAREVSSGTCMGDGMTAERYDAFVSYGHGDAEWTQALAENLHRLGLHVFLDKWELVAGDLIAVRLQQGLAAADAVVFAWTARRAGASGRGGRRGRRWRGDPAGGGGA